jgi:hypothetical protein
LIIVGCAFASREAYSGRTIFIPLKSSPEGARVLLDGRQEGFTPVTLKFSYLQSQHGSSEDEIRKRILKIERDGYEPYILSFSIRDKEHEKIPNPVFLKKSEDIVKAKDSLGKEQQKRQELKEKGEALKALKEVEKPVNKIALIGKSSAFIDNTLDSPLKDQHKTQELKEAKEKINNSLEKIAESRNESPLSTEKDNVQKIKQNNDTIEASSNNDDKNIVQARPDKEIDNTNKFINNLKVDLQDASKTIYTIQTGSFLKLEKEPKNSLIQYCKY